MFRGTPTAEGAEAALSARELEFLRLFGSGQTLGAITEIMGVSPKTIANISANLKTKLGLNDGLALARHAKDGWALRNLGPFVPKDEEGSHSGTAVSACPLTR